MIHLLKMHLSDLKEKEKHKTYGAVTELTAHNYLEEVSEAGASSRVYTLSHYYLKAAYTRSLRPHTLVA